MKSYTRISFLAALFFPLVSGAMFGQWSLSLNAAAPGDFVGTTNNEDLSLRSFAFDRMRILASNGFTRIGSSTPSITPQRRLHIYDANAAPQLRLQDPSGYWDLWGGQNFHIQEAGTDWLYCDAFYGHLWLGPGTSIFMENGVTTGYVGIGTSSPVSKLTVDGTITPDADCSYNIGSSTRKWNAIWACNGTIQTSDASTKENIQNLGYGLTEIMKLNPISFTWKNNPAEGKKLGFIAQELQPVLNEVVKTGEDGSMGVLYSDIIPVLVKAMQEQDAELSRETAENIRLREELQEQENRLARLEAAVSGDK